MGQEGISVLVVDDDHLVRQALLDYLGIAEDIEVIGQCDSGEASVSFVQEHEVDVVLMDIHLPGMDGVQATQAIRGIRPKAKVLVLTSFDDDEVFHDALAVGAVGFLLKTTPSAAMADAIRSVHRGITVMSGAPVSRFCQPRPRVRLQQETDLTRREFEILGHLCRGLSNAEIATQLFLSESTVKTYVTALMGKLGVSTRLKAVVRAHELGLDRN